ncbi:uncharacterized protein N7477_003204 [Penicillium maclennaniae]|uniref:uncharacterized protein n=1 Tax=Penicillium maclennaniae TaxID=1343394 RepID=UPI0025424320|nr:uncharacterized protein N7477_003204 [Penicillium maclennaniae]KAJ5677571.1 hypothetical protein N7477_003204 [Penicillium maclennaniae]
MALSTGHVASQLRHLIYYHLDNNLIRNALFLAGRLHAYEPRSFEAQYLISLCHLHNGEIKAAFDHSQSSGSRGLHLGCAYVFAQACLDLGKHLDGIAALERSKGLWATKNNWNKHNETQRQHLPDAAAVYCLLGKLWHTHKDLNKAVDCYVDSLKLNPFMWDAFLGLCATGVNIRVPNIYQLSPELLAIISSSSEENDFVPDRVAPAEGAFPVHTGHNAPDPFMVSASRNDADATYGSSALWEKLNGSSVNVASVAPPVIHEGMETPQSSGSDEFRIANRVNDPESAWEPPLAPTRKNRTIQSMSLDHPGNPPSKMRPTGIRPRTKTRTDPEDPHLGPSEENLHLPPESVIANAPSLARLLIHYLLNRLSQVLPNVVADGREVKKVRSMHSKGRPTTSTVGRVGQRETPWVLAQLGRAYFEQAMYTDAAKYFSRVQSLAPSRLEDMEIYSTVLWHLKSDVELAYLAHQSLEADRLSPQAWCALGNSFSHQRDHDQALKCFKRATMIDPEFAYAFTLQGHEYVANEEYDKALDAYRHGITADNRHYNAWYGLGTVYDKMGKLDFAEQHFRNAATINPTNAVLICCIGLVLEKMDNPKNALVHYERACSLAPHSVLARFRKARVLMKMQEFKFALAELKVLKDMAPDEANVHYLLGKLYKMLHDKANAIKHFTTALNLDPKAAQFIKDAMESLDDDEMEDEDMA